jgi:hypothetical protein
MMKKMTGVGWAFGRRVAVVAIASAAALTAMPPIASAAVKAADCNADGQWFRTDTFYTAATTAEWHVSNVQLTLENNNSNKNNVLYHVRGEHSNRTYFSWVSGDNFPGKRTVEIKMDTWAPRNDKVYVQGMVNADQTVDSKCWTPRQYL